MNFLEKSEEDLEADVEVIINDQKAVAKKYDDIFLGTYLPSIEDKAIRRKYQRLAKRLADQRREDAPKSKSVSVENLSSYDVLKVVAPPYNLDYLAKLYEINATHHSAVNAKAVNVAGLGWDVAESPSTQLKIEKAQSSPKKSLEALTFNIKTEKLKLMETIDNLNDDELSEILTRIWTDVEAIGNGYMEIGRNRDGTIGFLGHIPGTTIRVRANRDGFIQISGNKYVFFRNYGEKTVDPTGNDASPNEIIQFKKYFPKSTYYGVPDIIAALAALNGDISAKEYNQDFFDNKAVPRYAFITKGVRLSQQAEDNLMNFFRNELKGKHHGTLYIPLPASINQNVDAKFEPIETRPTEQSFVHFIKDSRLEILIAHRVPPGKLGIYENTNLAVARDADKTFKEQVIRPEQRRLEKKFNKIIDEFSSGRFVFKLGEPDIIDADVRSRMHDRYARTRVMKPNEIRKDIGLPSVPDGEEFLPVPGTLDAGNTPQAPGKAQGNRARSSTTGEKPQSDGGAQRAERGAEQDRGARPKTT